MNTSIEVSGIDAAALLPGANGIQLGDARLFRFGEGLIVLEAEPAPSGEQMNVQRRVIATAARLRAVLADPGNGAAGHLHELHLQAISDIVPGDGNLGVFFRPRPGNELAVCKLLIENWQSSQNPAEMLNPGLHRLQVRYGGEGGPDLATLANTLGITPAALIDRHTSGEYTVAFLGFQPGFAYLEGLDPALHCPRRALPRSRVRANSLAIAGHYCAVYPAASPGGWHIIGEYLPGQPQLFESERKPPALLQAGDRVQFEPVC